MPQLSSLQARRRFMITDILNSVEVRREEEGAPARGLDMRLLFPGLPPARPNTSPDLEAESGDEEGEGEDDGSEKGG